MAAREIVRPGRWHGGVCGCTVFQQIVQPGWLKLVVVQTQEVGGLKKGTGGGRR
jgi:hypothetical protein